MLKNISKTTINGILSCAIAVIVAVAALPPKLAIPVYILAALRAAAGYLQQDAGTTEALVPGSPNPVPVPSHEMPNDPSAVPVAKP